MTTKLIAPLLAVLATIAVADLPGPVPAPAPNRMTGSGPVACDDCNVVLISADTLRPDHLGCYGYPVETSPALDELCRDGIRFDRAFTTAPSTLPAHASLFTSMLPSAHRASRSAELPLSQEAVTLAEVLRDHGFETAAFVDGGQMDPVWGVGQGFDVYSSRLRRRFRTTVEDGVDWLERRRDPERPFLLLLHSYEVHHPYTPAERFIRRLGTDYQGPLPWWIPIGLLEQVNRGNFLLDREDLAHVERMYDAEIRALDRGIRRLTGALRRAGLYESSLVVLVSDHGEEFGEHGQVGWHAHTLFNELLRVALVIKLPGSSHAGSVVRDTVSLLDVYPTVLEMLGIEPPGDPAGRSLLDTLEDAGRGPWAVAVSEQEHGLAGTAIQTRRWKLLDSRLYDLRSDPGETRDVAREAPGIRAVLEARLRDLLERPGLEPVEPIEMGPDTIDQLRALGYIR